MKLKKKPEEELKIFSLASMHDFMMRTANDSCDTQTQGEISVVCSDFSEIGWEERYEPCQGDRKAIPKEQGAELLAETSVSLCVVIFGVY